LGKTGVLTGSEHQISKIKFDKIRRINYEDFRSPLILSWEICSFDQCTLTWERTLPPQFFVICFPTLVLEESNPVISPGYPALKYVLEKASSLNAAGYPNDHIFISVDASGPRTEPCGYPRSILMVFDLASEILTKKEVHYQPNYTVWYYPIKFIK